MPNTPERRHAPRYELIAQASIDSGSGSDMYLMPVRNISATGAYLEGNPAEHPELKPGVELELVLSASAPGMGDDEVDNIPCKGRVARVEQAKGTRAGGFGITLQPATKEDALRLKALIGRLAHLPPPRPATLSA
jgi:hypothetical protein